jgi:hypothetical protein
MSDKVKHKRGLLANIPNLEDGQLGYATDAKRLFIGNGGTNDEVSSSNYLYPQDGSITSADIGKILAASTPGLPAKVFASLPGEPFGFRIDISSVPQVYTETPADPGIPNSILLTFQGNPTQDEVFGPGAGGNLSMCRFTTVLDPDNSTQSESLYFDVLIGASVEETMQNLANAIADRIQYNLDNQLDFWGEVRQSYQLNSWTDFFEYEIDAINASILIKFYDLLGDFSAQLLPETGYYGTYNPGSFPNSGVVSFSVPPMNVRSSNEFAYNLGTKRTRPSSDLGDRVVLQFNDPSTGSLDIQIFPWDGAVTPPGASWLIDSDLSITATNLKNAIEQELIGQGMDQYYVIDVNVGGLTSSVTFYSNYNNNIENVLFSASSFVSDNLVVEQQGSAGGSTDYPIGVLQSVIDSSTVSVKISPVFEAIADGPISGGDLLSAVDGGKVAALETGNGAPGDGAYRALRDAADGEKVLVWKRSAWES